MGHGQAQRPCLSRFYIGSKKTALSEILVGNS
ncbi:MAG: hypothetical protein ACI9B9_001574 [Halioglobus sp.]